MTSKKRRGAPSASMPTFDQSRFISQAASQRYHDLVVNKSLIPERGLSPKLGLDGRMYAQIEARNWFDFVGQPESAVVSVVKEFYANAEERDGCMVFVRGKWVSFDRATINAHYNVPNFGNDDYCTYKDHHLDLDQVKAELCRPGAEWRIIHERPGALWSKDMNRYNKAWLNFLGAKLMPVTHFSDVTLDRAILLYAIVTDMSIDVGRVIQQSIIHSIRSTTTGGLGHPSLICALCKQAGVVWESDEGLLHPKSLINHAAIQGFQSWDDQDTHQALALPKEDLSRRHRRASKRALNICEWVSRIERAVHAQRRVLHTLQARNDQFMNYQIVSIPPSLKCLVELI